MTRVAVLNAVAQNGGDAAILFSVFDLVRDVLGADTTFVVFDKAPAVSRRLYPDVAFEPMLWLSPRSLSRLAKCDLAVSTGGTYLVPEYRLWPRAFELLAAVRLGKPLVLFPQTIGAYRRSVQRLLLRRALSPSRRVLLRDEPSRRSVIDLGVPADRCRVAPDAVFASADRAVLEAAAARRMPATEPRIAVSVRDLGPFASGLPGSAMSGFVAAVRGLVEHAVRALGAHVLFLSTCQGVPEYRYDDSAVAARIVEGLAPEVRARTEVDRGFHPPSEIARRLGEADLVVATRMHAGILALVAGTPVLPIAYEPKTRALFEDLGQRDLVHDAQTADAASLAGALDRFVREIDGRRAGLFAKVAERGDAVRAAAREALA